MLALHLIQNCMVYINMLMIQKVLAQPHWQGKLTPRDYAALTPLIWEHVNPYGRFDLDMNARLALLCFGVRRLAAAFARAGARSRTPKIRPGCGLAPYIVSTARRYL